MSAERRGRPRGTGIPVAKRDDLSQGDFELLDEAEFERIRTWNAKRQHAGDDATRYHLDDFRPAVFIDNLNWLVCYCLRLRSFIRDSRSTRHLRELQTENARLARELRLADPERVKRLEFSLATCKREMRKWGLKVPAESSG